MAQDDRDPSWVEADKDDGAAEQEKADNAAEGPDGDHVSLHGTPEQLGQFFAALARAQGAFDDIGKDTTGQMGHRNFRYADYAAIRKATSRQLAAEGIAIVQPITRRGTRRPRVTTILSGHGAIVSSWIDFARPKDVKEFGLVSTYIRRYAYKAIIAVEGDDDADNDPGRPGGDAPRREPPTPQKPQGRTVRETVNQAQKPPEAPPAEDPRQLKIPPEAARELERAKEQGLLKTADEVAAQPERPKSVPPPLPKKETPAETVERIDPKAPIKDETQSAIRALTTMLYSDPKVAMGDCMRVTGVHAGEVLRSPKTGSQGNEALARTFLHWLQEQAIEKGIATS